MYLDDSNWMEAYNEFYEAFRAYQVAGNPRAKDCLKYVVLASILALSDINPFAAREAKVRVSKTTTDNSLLSNIFLSWLSPHLLAIGD